MHMRCGTSSGDKITLHGVLPGPWAVLKLAGIPAESFSIGREVAEIVAH